MDGGGGGEELYNNHTDVTLQIIRQTMSIACDYCTAPE